MAYSFAWVEDQPTDTDYADNGDNTIIYCKKMIRERIDSFCPFGVVVPWMSETAPFGWLECNGAAISRTVYADLFAAIGTAFGEGDGSTTFNIPDLRGRFYRPVDNGASRAQDAADKVIACDTTNASTTVSINTPLTRLAEIRVGAPVSGAGIAAGTRIASITDLDEFELTIAAIADGTAVDLTIENDSVGAIQSEQFAEHQHYVSQYSSQSLYHLSFGTGETKTTGDAGLGDTRPKNVAVMFIIRAVPL